MIRKLAIDRNTPDSADLRQRRGCCFDTAVNDTLQNKRNIPGLGQRILRVEHVSLDEQWRVQRNRIGGEGDRSIRAGSARIEIQSERDRNRILGRPRN